MRKLFSIVIMLLVALSAWAVDVDNLSYTVTSEPSGNTPGQLMCTGLSTAGKNQTSLALVIPRVVTIGSKKYVVTHIRNLAFAGAKNITQVNMRYGISSIGSLAFQNCTGIRWILIPSSVKTINSQIISGCSSLTAVYLANTDPRNTDFADDAFTSTTKPTLYVPTGSETSYHRQVTALGTTYFPTIATSSVAYDFFFSTGDMSVVTKPSTGDGVPAELTIIGFSKSGGNTNASQGNLTLAGGTINPAIYERPLRYTAVAFRAFYQNTDLTAIDLTPATTITSLGSAFAQKCTNLKTAKLGSGAVPFNAFDGCTALTSVELGAGVTDASPHAFDVCPALKSINVDAANTHLSSISGELFDKDKTTLIRMPEGRTGVTVIPATCTSIGLYAFYNVAALDHIVIPWGVRSIGTYAFAGCTKLATVDVPSSVNELGNYAFKGCTALADFYINTKNPITITKGEMFKDAANPRLYVPRYHVDDYKNAGWKNFKSYNSAKDAFVPQDAFVNSMGFTLLEFAKPSEVHGKIYDGECYVVRSRWNNISGTVTVPASITAGGKEFAVTEFAPYAFNGTSEYKLEGCANVMSVDDYAFYKQPITQVSLPMVISITNYAFAECTKLTQVKWGNRLNIVGDFAFSNTAITNDIILPVGCKQVGQFAFKNAKSKFVLVPSTIKDIYIDSFSGMSQLDTLMINSRSETINFRFTDLPRSTRLVVPYGSVPLNNRDEYLKIFNYVFPGAYDIVRDGDRTSPYTITVTDTKAITVDGVTYAGKAKYVRNPKTKSFKGTYEVNNDETDDMTLTPRKYLMTGIGDMLCVEAIDVTHVTLERMQHIASIDSIAFWGTNIVKVNLPNVPRLYIGKQAFQNIYSLQELVIPSKTLTYGEDFFGHNSSLFTCYLDYSNIAQAKHKLMKSVFDDNEKCDNRLAPCFTATATTLPLGQLVPLDVSGFPQAYIVRSVGDNGVLKTEKVTTVNFENSGVILAGLTPGQFYKVPRASNSQPSTGTNMLKANNSISTINLYSTANYIWYADDMKFVKPFDHDRSQLESGLCRLDYWDKNQKELYLDVMQPGSGNAGDVNGDGNIDVSDVNLAINVMLGKATKADYPAADVNGDGIVDVSDVNLIINIMLGK